ncbi:MAG TPA: TonB-dependent copper receptor [Rhodocyclaceae bacterium]|nr:TonB-dependent copper receptor [Rhodocyclaceae bacterium]
MKPIAKSSAMALAIAAAFPVASPATELEPVVVTAPAMATPLVVRFDPKAPQQPLPAQDGAAFLKTIPGMSVIRKGGTDGDPVFRGMAASRLNILLDGEQILGGCGMRMDPPTAYVYPETYDRVTLLKGPQTVLYGPGNSAGTVLFERSNKRLDEPGMKFNGSLMGGSFGRHDEVVDVRAGTPNFYVRGNATNSHSEDYEDGDGKKVHSKYNRWSAGGAIGWTPDRDTRLELTATRSDGQAAYADRTMDGAKFARENYGLKFEKRNVTSWLEKVEAQAYYNYIDHVMDNYSLRSRGAAMPMVNNPDRETVGGRLAFTLRPADATKLVLGADTQSNKHTLRTTANQNLIPYQSLARAEDANFDQKGLFGEWTQDLGEQDRIVAGLRGDWWKAQDKRQRLLNNTVANPTANAKRDKVLTSGFGRWEHDFAGEAGTVYAGVGHSERFPDYWELVSANKEGPTAADLSAFATTRPEKTTQLDVGTTWKAGPWNGFVAGFYNKIDDFILIQSGIARVAPNRNVSIVRNVDATTWGGEAGVGYAFTSNLRGDASLAYVRGTNDTEDRPLAQIPPLEGRLGLTWDNRVWTVGTLLRLVAAQGRYATNEGNVVGQDIGRTPGFAVFSINGGWRPAKGVLIAAGVDNLFDKTYAEHISRAGAMVAGFEQTTRVNEPGRTLWLKASIALD